MSRICRLIATLGVAITCSTVVFAETKTPAKDSDTVKPASGKIVVAPPVEKAPEDKPVEPLKVSNEPLVFENAIQTIASALHMKKVAIGLLGDEYPHTIKMASCVSLPNANVVEVYHTKSNGKVTRLVLLNGEKSGLHLLFGEDCSDTIALNAVDTSILAEVTTKSARFGKKGAPEMVLPITLKGRSPTLDGTRVSYQTIDGFFTIYQDDPKVLTSLLETKSGETIFKARYEVVNHICPDASIDKDKECP